MYLRFAEQKGFKTRTLDVSEAEAGGFKEVVAEIEGEGAYSMFRFESGVHRVQRVPKTETQGRVHTSAATVAVMPEAEEVDVKIEDKDLRIDTFCSGGKGGQSVNTTYSAVRLTHIPTNTVVSCQDERSQIKNMAKAMTVLRSRLLQKAMDAQNQANAALRKSQVGSGDRSEKIRTYNFPQSRVSDHRVNVTIHSLDKFMQGDLDIILEPLRAQYEADRLQASELTGN
jgi:peptide chain release factor 1